MNKDQLLELLRRGSYYAPSENSKTIEQEITEMYEAEIKEAVIEYVYSRPKTNNGNSDRAK